MILLITQLNTAGAAICKKKRYKGEPSPEPAQARPAGEVLAELKGDIENERNYREESLKVHGLVCAKCGR